MPLTRTDADGRLQPLHLADDNALLTHDASFNIATDMTAAAAATTTTTTTVDGHNTEDTRDAGWYSCYFVTYADYVGRRGCRFSNPSVCLFVSGITQKRMIPKCSNLI